MTATNVEVAKNQNEGNAMFIRRFTKRLQGSNTLKKARKLRFFSRTLSSLKKKEKAIKRIKKQKEIDRLKKLGKIK